MHPTATCGSAWRPHAQCNSAPPHFLRARLAVLPSHMCLQAKCMSACGSAALACNSGAAVPGEPRQQQAGQHSQPPAPEGLQVGKGSAPRPDVADGGIGMLTPMDPDQGGVSTRHRPRALNCLRRQCTATVRRFAHACTCSFRSQTPPPVPLPNTCSTCRSHGGVHYQQQHEVTCPACLHAALFMPVGHIV